MEDANVTGDNRSSIPPGFNPSTDAFIVETAGASKPMTTVVADVTAPTPFSKRGHKRKVTMGDQEELVSSPNSKCADESTRKGKNKKKRLPKDSVGSEEEQGRFSLMGFQEEEDPESNDGIKASRKKKRKKQSLDDTAADTDNEQIINEMRSIEEGIPDTDIGKAENGKKRKKKRLLEEAKKANKRGVCYLSRIPPRMDFTKLHQILSQYGEIQRIYLVPEDPSVQVLKRASKYKSQGFSEGWVEFTNKFVAKSVANMLNGEQVGGRRKSSNYYDLWNIKYLSKFKWDDLTEEIAYKSAVREQKLNLEISAAKRERDFYLSKVDKSRALRSIEERMKKKQKVQQESENKSEPSVNEQPMKVIRQFQQKQPVVDKAAENKRRLSRDILAGVFR